MSKDKIHNTIEVIKMSIHITTGSGKFAGKVIKGILHQQISFIDIDLKRRVWYDETTDSVEYISNGKWIHINDVENVVYTR